MRVLIPPFVNEEGKIVRNGERLADQLRKQVNEMPTHAPADMKDAEAQMKKFGVKMADMNCITWKQLASQMNGVQLVLCGTLDETTKQVTANFEPVGGGADPFKVQPFTFESPDQGAQQIVQAFGVYVRGLSLALNCRDYIDNQSWQQALDNCNQAIEINPASIGATYSRGTALRNLDRPEEALEAYKKVLELDPLNKEAMMAAGYVAVQLGQQDQALEYFHQYLQLEPEADQVRLVIASRLAEEGDPAAAVRLLEEATAKPDAGRTVILYAGHFAMNAGLMRQQAGPASGNGDEEATALMRKALEHYERAYQMAPDSADALLLRQMMVAYRGVGNQEKALEIGQLATAAPTVDGQTWLVYSDVLREAGRTDESVAALDRAQQLDPQIPVNSRKAIMFLDEGRLQEAVAAAKAGIASNEIPADVAESISQRITQLGLGHTNAKRFEQAITHYQAAREIGKSERSIGMANFFQGFTLLQQADALLRTATTAGPARQAKPILERAKVLLEGAGGYTDQAAKRAELLQNINQFIEMADALIRAG